MHKMFSPNNIYKPIFVQIRKHFFQSITNNKADVRLLSTYKGILKMKNLAVFDFDHTIIEGNSDVVVRNLLSVDLIPTSLKKLYTKEGWTAYMQGVFELLHVNGFNEDQIASAIKHIPETKGMKQLIENLVDLNYDVIIISDANSYLIDVWLRHNELSNKILKVFTNPAKFNKNGLLKIEMFHLQTECQLSTKNLCKGRILDEFIEQQKQCEVMYDKIIYAGDGSNDFCPMLRLKENDLACVRDKYKCLEMVNNTLLGKPLSTTGLTYQIIADVFVWNDGIEILNKIKNS